MTKQLENQFRLNNDSQYKSLYTWSIEETTGSDGRFSGDMVPFYWNCQFLLKDPHTAVTLAIGEDDFLGENLGQPQESKKTKTTRVIRALAVPHSHNNWPPRYRFFGTDRDINAFDLTIFASDDGNSRCRLSGFVGTDDDDLQDSEDQIFVQVSLPEKEFAQLFTRLDHGKNLKIFLSLQCVAGFYARWSPEITASEIKILGADNLEALIAPANSEITPPKLGQVEKFSLQVVSLAQQVPEQPANSGGSTSEPHQVVPSPSVPDPMDMVSTRLAKLENGIHRRLGYLLTLVAVLIIVIAFK